MYGRLTKQKPGIGLQLYKTNKIGPVSIQPNPRGGRKESIGPKEAEERRVDCNGYMEEN